MTQRRQRAPNLQQQRRHQNELGCWATNQYLLHLNATEAENKSHVCLGSLLKTSSRLSWRLEVLLEKKQQNQSRFSPTITPGASHSKGENGKFKYMTTPTSWFMTPWHCWTGGCTLKTFMILVYSVGGAASAAELRLHPIEPQFPNSDLKAF